MELHSNLLSFLAGVTLRSLGLAAVAWVAMALCRVKSPAARHAVWTLVAAGLLLLAAASAALPGVPVRVLPARPTQPRFALATPATVLPAVTHPLPQVQPFPWDSLAASIYLAGLLAFAGRLAYAYLLTRRLVRSGRPIPAFAGSAVHESSSISVPLTVGWLRPKILLPEGWDAWPPEKLDAVLVHERTHIARADWAVAVLASVNRCVFWFHPLAWWLERQLTTLAELACDDASLAHVASRATYAEVLVEMAAAVRTGEGRVVWEAMAMAKAAGVRVRVERILDESREIPPGLTRARWFTAALCALPLIYMAAVLRPSRIHAQTPAPAPVEQPQTQPVLPPPTPDAPDPELQAARQQLERLNAEIARFRAANQGRLPDQPSSTIERLVSNQAALAAANEAISRLQRQLLELETQLQNNNTNLNYFRTLTSGQAESAQVREQSLVQQRQRIETLNGEIAALSEQLSPNHPTLKRAQANLEALLFKYQETQRQSTAEASRAVSDINASNNVLKTDMQNLQLQLEQKLRQMEELNQSRIEASARLEQQYAELLRSQALARRQVEELSHTADAATGPSLLSRRDPEYTPSARQAGIQGTVELSVTIGTDGIARDLQVLRSLDPGLDRNAIECVKTWRFRPATRDGHPVTAFATVEVKFRLQ